MPEKSRLSQITLLALPIVGAMASQNVLNLVDMWMVGHLGAPALAAVGIASFTNFVVTALIIGLSSAVQAMAARRIGEGRKSEAAVPLNGGILLSLSVGLPLGVGLALLAPRFFPLLNPDPAVVREGVPYLQARLLACAALGINFSFRGFWNGIRKSSLYMITLIVMHSINILLDAILIFGLFGAPKLGTMGAGVASAVALSCGMLMYLTIALLIAREYGFFTRWPTRAEIGSLVRLAVPSCIQQLFFSGGMLALFWIISNLVGTNEAAAANILINVLLVAYLPGLALGLAAATLVGQALGRGDSEDAGRWGAQVARVGMIVLGCLGLPMILFPEQIAGLFIKGADAGVVIPLARYPMMISGAGMCLEAVGLIYMNALLGAGDSRSVMLVSVFLQWGLFLPVAFLLGHLGFGLIAIWSANLVYRGLMALSFYGLWKRGHWQKIRI